MDRGLTKFERLISLSQKLASTRIGISVSQIASGFGVTRRTVERLLVELRILVGDRLEFRFSEGGERLWYLLDNPLKQFDQPSEHEILALDLAVGAMERIRQPREARLLRSLATKIGALSTQGATIRRDLDPVALAQAKTYATRPGPRQDLDQRFLSEIESAIGARRKIEITYISQKSTKPGRRKLGPLGLIIGRFHYLVAYEDSQILKNPKTFRLDRIRKMTTLDEPFSPPKGLSIDDYARRSFGVYDQEAVKVVWRFDRKTARDAALIQFHPSQKLSKPRKDGALDVTFEAGSLREMVWELLTWGDGVEVLHPPALVTEWQRQLDLSRMALERSQRRNVAK